MRAYTVADGVDLDAGTTNGSAISTSDLELPFQPGNTVVAQVSIQSWAEAELVGVTSFALQGSDNAFSGWEDLIVAGGLANSPVVVAEIVLPQYIRTRVVSATAGDGRGAIQLLSN